MADCKLCAKPVVTHWYVRAKVQDPEKPDVFVGLSSAGKPTRLLRPDTSCEGHDTEAIANAIFGSFPPAAYPVRLLWSPEIQFGPTPDSKKKHIRAMNVSERKAVNEKLRGLLGIV